MSVLGRLQQGEARGSRCAQTVLLAGLLLLAGIGALGWAAYAFRSAQPGTLGVMDVPAARNAQQAPGQQLQAEPASVEIVQMEADRPEPIEFAAGSPSARMSGTVPALAAKRYVLRGLVGQTLGVTLETADQETYLTVLTPKGENMAGADGPIHEWSGRLPVDGDYVIEVINPEEDSAEFWLTTTLSMTPVDGRMFYVDRGDLMEPDQEQVLVAQLRPEERQGPVH